MRDHNMKKHTKVVLGATSLLLGVGILGYAITAQASGGHKKGDGMHAMKMFDRFDTNKDGKVTSAEVDALIDAQIAGVDGDKSNSLTKAEFTQLLAVLMEERINRRFAKLDDNKDGVISADELKQPAQRMVSWLDDDGDKAVSQKEAREGMSHRRRGHHEDHDRDDDRKN
ncbi:MAG: EF-hand domain-containing protein [Rhodospirillales bacterium]